MDGGRIEGAKGVRGRRSWAASWGSVEAPAYPALQISCPNVADNNNHKTDKSNSSNTNSSNSSDHDNESLSLRPCPCVCYVPHVRQMWQWFASRCGIKNKRPSCEVVASGRNGENTTTMSTSIWGLGGELCVARFYDTYANAGGTGVLYLFLCVCVCVCHRPLTLCRRLVYLLSLIGHTYNWNFFPFLIKAGKWWRER